MGWWFGATSRVTGSISDYKSSLVILSHILEDISEMDELRRKNKRGDLRNG
jgi:hypothetical protein